MNPSCLHPLPHPKHAPPRQKILREITAKLYRNLTNPYLVNPSKLESKKATYEQKKNQ